MNNNVMVSVPSQGYLFLNRKFNFELDKRSCFRPSRGYLFLNNCGNCQEALTRFRPLSGLSISQWRWRNYMIKKESFRPSQGYLFLNPDDYLDEFCGHAFPSPLGVIYFSIRKNCINGEIKFREFPSPLGVIYFSIMQSDYDFLQTSSFPSPLGVIYSQ